MDTNQSAVSTRESLRDNLPESRMEAGKVFAREIGSFSQDLSSHTTNIVNQDDTKKTEICSVSGKSALLTELGKCIQCNQWALQEFISNGAKCVQCAEHGVNDFRNTIHEMLADGRIDETERKLFEEKANALGLARDETEKIVQQVRLERTGESHELSSRETMLFQEARDKLIFHDPLSVGPKAREEFESEVTDTLRTLSETCPQNLEVAEWWVRCLILLGKNEDALNVLQSLPAFRVDTPLKFILSIEAHQRKHTPNEDHKTIGYLERSAIAAFPDDPLILAKKLELNTDLFLCNMAEGKQNQDLANTILSECKIILETKSSWEKTVSAFYLSFVLNYVVWAVGKPLETKSAIDSAKAQNAQRFHSTLVSNWMLTRSVFETKDKVKVTWAQMAAFNQSPTALYHLSYHMWVGNESIPENKELSIQLLNNAEKLGHFGANSQLASIYDPWSENNFQDNIELALEHYHACSLQNCPHATDGLGYLSIVRKGDAQSYQEAYTYMHQAISLFEMNPLPPYEPMHYCLSEVFYSDGNWFPRKSYLYLGRMYMGWYKSFLNGLGGQANVSKGLSLLERGAHWEEKTEDSRYIIHANLGTYHLENTLDYNKALQYFLKAAEKGLADAMYQVGSIYQNGQGVEKDMKKAFHWYERGANLGDAACQSVFGSSFYIGVGNYPKNFQLAVEWWEKAFLQGNDFAAESLAMLFSGQIPTIYKGTEYLKDGVRACRYWRYLSERNYEPGGYSLIKNPPDIELARIREEAALDQATAQLQAHLNIRYGDDFLQFTPPVRGDGEKIMKFFDIPYSYAYFKIIIDITNWGHLGVDNGDAQSDEDIYQNTIKIQIIDYISEELYRSEYNYEVTMLYAGEDRTKWKKLVGCDSWTIINPDNQWTG